MLVSSQQESRTVDLQRLESRDQINDRLAYATLTTSLTFHHLVAIVRLGHGQITQSVWFRLLVVSMLFLTSNTFVGTNIWASRSLLLLLL